MIAETVDWLPPLLQSLGESQFLCIAIHPVRDGMCCETLNTDRYCWIQREFMPFTVSTLCQNLSFAFHHPLIIRFIFTLISDPDYSFIEFQTIIYKQYDADIRNLHYIILKNSKEASLKGNLAEGECVGKCGMPNDNEDRIDSDRLMCEGIYLESDLCSSKVHY